MAVARGWGAEPLLHVCSCGLRVHRWDRWELQVNPGPNGALAAKSHALSNVIIVLVTHPLLLTFGFKE